MRQAEKFAARSLPLWIRRALTLAGGAEARGQERPSPPHWP